MPRASRITRCLGDRAIGADAPARYPPNGAGNRVHQPVVRAGYAFVGANGGCSFLYPGDSAALEAGAAACDCVRSIGHVKITPMAEAARDPAARFSDRAEDYVKYRPHYSPDVVQASAASLRPAARAPHRRRRLRHRAAGRRSFSTTAIASSASSPIARCASPAKTIWQPIPTSAWWTAAPRPRPCPTRASTSSSPGRPSTGFGPTRRAPSSRAF